MGNTIMIGQNVVWNGREGVVANRAGDAVQIKFPDGETAFVPEREVEPILVISMDKNTQTDAMINPEVRSAKDRFDVSKNQLQRGCV